jgi:hypothetical protein
VTIRTKEPEIPTEFPPARLFLDDIEEIVRTLLAANKDLNPGVPPGEGTKLKVTFTIKDQECDEVEELPKIAKKTAELSILLGWESGYAANSLTFRRDGSYLATYMLEKEGHLSLFHRLAPIFKRRNLWLRTLVHSHRQSSLTLIIASCLTVVTVAEMFISKHPNDMAGTIALALLLMSIIITISTTTLYRHTIIIMRRSSEPSPVRQELLQKAPLAAITSVLTFLLTLLGFYLKHKYWP